VSATGAGFSREALLHPAITTAPAAIAAIHRAFMLPSLF
jgi:hypothetical protein